MVRCSIGPRHATAADAESTNIPIETTFTPYATGGRIMSSTRVGRGRDAVLIGEAEDAGDREAVHVGIHDAHAQAALGEGDREVRGDRRLADAALAARHRVDAGQRVGPELLRRAPGGPPAASR